MWTPGPIALPDKQVWFAPNFASADFVELFRDPQAWSGVREELHVFQFYTQNVIGRECEICGQNELRQLAEVDAFEKLNSWGIAIAVEAGSVTESSCSASQGLEAANIIVSNIELRGGQVSFLAMDEPLFYGQVVVDGRSCGYGLSEVADATASFIERFHDRHPHVRVGDIEPYPRYSVAELERWIEALEDRGVSLAFFHLDVDLEYVRTGGFDVIADLRELRQFCQRHSIPFGVIVTSNWTQSGSNQSYYYSALGWVATIDEAVGRPEHVIFQSWQGPAPSGLYEIPVNLARNDPDGFSHTSLIEEGLAIFGR